MVVEGDGEQARFDRITTQKQEVDDELPRANFHQALRVQET